ncbi:Multidrug transporter MdtA [Fuerstiella marisgermanici]|uniref:Multidrug transporter MdtA n=2 Tax=Fuerstiella marisgermanici TaxID=1891926 RepID=A0A1P8WHZ6_9PLAN|nr:Multidrug transporter MdtA [Fuerstiella marisgermanici]
MADSSAVRDVSDLLMQGLFPPEAIVPLIEPVVTFRRIPPTDPVATAVTSVIYWWRYLKFCLIAVTAGTLHAAKSFQSAKVLTMRRFRPDRKLRKFSGSGIRQNAGSVARSTTRFAILLSGLVLLASGCSRNSAAERDAESKDKLSQPVAVKTVAVTQQDVQASTVQPATVLPFYEAAIRAKVHGYVKDVKVDIGDVVEQGATLAVIDVPESLTQRQQAVARLQQQKAEIERANAGIQLAEANVASAEALAEEARSKMQQVEASLAAAQSEFGRTEDLVKRGSMQPRVLDEVRERRDSAAAGKSAVTAAIGSADASVNVAKAELAAAKADAKAAEAKIRIQEAELAEIDELIGFATLKSPFAGVITARNVSPGNLVSERSTGEPLFIVSQMHKVRIHIPVPENEAAHVERGDSISVRFPSFAAEEAMTVEVSRLTGRLDPSTRTMLVEAEVANDDRKLIPGMFGHATISLSTATPSNVLPARAVRFSEDGAAYVYVVKSGEVSVVPVTTGEDDGHNIQIVSGLETGQTVLDAHLQRFRDGQEVRVLK